MKSSSVCPKCDHKKLYVVEEPLCRVDTRHSPGATATLTIAHHLSPTGERGLLGPKEGTYTAPVEAWVCAACGYTELYTRYLQVLEHLAVHLKDKVRVVDGDTSTGAPYR